MVDRPSASTEFRYQALDNPKAQIRLIKYALEDSLGNRHYDIAHYDLTEIKEKYITISYTWGDAANIVPLLLNGKPTNVPRNSRDAIVDVSRYAPDRLIWLDAVCINQQDVQEKNAQVSLMRFIYSGASEVMIWLSDATFLSAVRNATDSLPPSEPNECLSFDVENRPDLPRWAEALQLGAHPYFYRMWIVQELLLCHRRTLIFADVTVDFQRIADLGRMAAKWLQKQDHINRLLLFVPILTEFSNAHWTLESLATFMIRGKCTDPRDYVYSLVTFAVAPRGQLDRLRPATLEVDYAKSTREVYQDFAEYMENYDDAPMGLHDYDMLVRVGRLMGFADDDPLMREYHSRLRVHQRAFPGQLGLPLDMSAANRRKTGNGLVVPVLDDDMRKLIEIVNGFRKAKGEEQLRFDHYQDEDDCESEDRGSS